MADRSKNNTTIVEITNSATELTTSATDAVLAIECIVIIVWLGRFAPRVRWRTALWCWVFGLVALSSLLGCLTHGFVMPVSVREALWKPLHLSLGVLVALFAVGAIYDWRGRVAAGRLVPWAIGLGAAFFGLTELLSGTFILFDVYEATAMVITLAIYLYLASTRRLKGAGVVAAAIVLNLIAVGLQFSDVSVRILVPFDHNGVFHLVQSMGIVMLGLGLHRGMQRIE